jgi:hypothetical protein
MKPAEARKLVATFEVAVERYTEAVSDNTATLRRPIFRIDLQKAREALLDALTPVFTEAELIEENASYPMDE